MTSTYPCTRLQNDEWQGVSWPIMAYGTCKADVEVKAVTWCCWWFGVVTEIIHRLESKWLFFRTFNDWGFICHLKPHTWVHSCPLCTCTLTHRWKDHVESYKLWRSSPSCLSMRPWPGQVLLVAACWLLGPDLLLPHYVSIAFVENRYKKDIETSPENMLLAHVIAVVQHKFKWDSRHCCAFHCRNLESDSCATRPSSQRFWGWWLHWESWIRSPTAPRKHRTNIDQHWSQGIMSTAD